MQSDMPKQWLEVKEPCYLSVHELTRVFSWSVSTLIKLLKT